MFKKISIVFCLLISLTLAVCLSGCTGGKDYDADIQALKDRISQLEQDNAAAKNKLLLLEGKVDGDPNKVYQLGDTVTYSSNGLKLFEIKVTAISLEATSPYRTLVDFLFVPYTFVEPAALGNFLSAQLVNADNTSLNNTSSLEGISFKRFVFANTQAGKKTLFICINSANMYIPFAVYNLTLTA